MAKPDVLPGEKILILVGDGASPEVFAHPCLINTERGIVFSANASSEVVPDCANPSAPGWNETEIDGLSATITGAGMTDLASVEMFDEWFRSGEAKTVKVKLDKTGGFTWTGKYKLTEWNPATGGRKQKATSSVTLVSDGEVTFGPNT